MRFTLPSPGFTPPIVLLDAPFRNAIPCGRFPSRVLPSAATPIKFPLNVLLLAPNAETTAALKLSELTTMFCKTALFDVGVSRPARKTMPFAPSDPTIPVALVPIRFLCTIIPFALCNVTPPAITFPAAVLLPPMTPPALEMSTAALGSISDSPSALTPM